jgi:hypothetical protein
MGCTFRTPVAEIHRQAEAIGQLAHELGVAIGLLAAGPVVQVCDRKPQAQFLRHLA